MEVQYSKQLFNKYCHKFQIEFRRNFGNHDKKRAFFQIEPGPRMLLQSCRQIPRHSLLSANEKPWNWRHSSSRKTSTHVKGRPPRTFVYRPEKVGEHFFFEWRESSVAKWLRKTLFQAFNSPTHGRLWRSRPDSRWTWSHWQLTGVGTLSG